MKRALGIFIELAALLVLLVLLSPLILYDSLRDNMKRPALALLLFLSLTSPALADSPALGPWDVLSTAQATRFITTARAADLTAWESPWQTAMRNAGICAMMFLYDGSGVRIVSANPGEDCLAAGRYGPVISFPEFRRRMEAP